MITWFLENWLVSSDVHSLIQCWCEIKNLEQSFETTQFCHEELKYSQNSWSKLFLAKKKTVKTEVEWSHTLSKKN